MWKSSRLECRLKKMEEKQFDEYRTRRVVLEVYDRLAALFKSSAT
jgi:hypothetical protein